MVSYDELQQAVAYGVHINIDTISVLDRFGHDYGNTVPVCIRINPHIMAGGNERISTGHIDSKFGISIHQMRHVERVVKSNNIHVNGLHMHTGSDILDAQVFLQGAELLLEIADMFPDVEFRNAQCGAMREVGGPRRPPPHAALLLQKAIHRINRPAWLAAGEQQMTAFGPHDQFLRAKR